MSTRPAHKRKRNRTLIVWKRWGDWRKIAIAVFTGLFIAVLLTVQLLPDKVSVRLGDVAAEDILAPRSVHYLDHAATQDLKKRIAAQVPKVYSTIAGADTEVRDAVSRFFDALLRIQRAGATETPERQLALVQEVLRGLSPELVREALSLSPRRLDTARVAAVDLATQTMQGQVLADTLEQTRAQVRSRAAVLDPSLPRQLIGEVVALNLVPNQLYNEEATEESRLREADLVPPQYETIRRGQVIVSAGERVTDRHLTQLRQVGLLRERIDVRTGLSLFGLAFGLVGVFCLYVYQFHLRLLRNHSNLLLVAVVVCGCLLLYRIGSTALGLRFSGDQLGYIGMASSALGAMLIAALLCPQVAVFVGVALAILTSVLVGEGLQFAIVAIVSSLVAVQAVTTIRNRAGILRAAGSVSAVNVLAALVAQGVTHDLESDVSQTVLWAIFGGFGSVMLFVLFAAWLERPFRLTTPLTLLELSDPSHPLLRRLAMEAPGTYHHSIIVGNLAEAAAEAISADALFCRVASYYHDVGKVVRPHFFVENQSSENRHNEINPSLSSLIVTSHVKDGVELAEQHKLPPPLIDIIKEHHGTCLIKYFYHRQVTTSTEEHSPGLEYQFRYEGPRPQTKESGIIMLADSVEAASRTLDKPTPGRIRDLIERILRDRLSDGQLDECELTFKDLEKIVSSMTRSMTSLLHARVEYPVDDSRNLRRLAADGVANKEPVGAQKALADTPETAATSLEGAAGNGGGSLS